MAMKQATLAGDGLSNRCETAQKFLNYTRYNCGIYLTNYLTLSSSSPGQSDIDLGYLATSFIPKDTRILYMPSSCRLSFEFFSKELLIPWNEWKDLIEKLTEYERYETSSSNSSSHDFNIFKYLSSDKIIYTVGLVGILNKLYSSSSNPSFMLQYFSQYWETLLIPNQTDSISGWGTQEFQTMLSSTSFLFHHLVPSATHHLQQILQRICLPFMKRFPEVFLFPSPPPPMGSFSSYLSLDVDGYLSRLSFCSLYSLVTSRVFSTNHPSDPSLSSPSLYSPLMFLPVIDYLNGTCEPNSENCSLELYQDEGAEAAEDGISVIKGMYNVITTRDVLAGEELTIQYLSSSQTVPLLTGYLFTYGILPYQIQPHRFHLPMQQEQQRHQQQQASSSQSSEILTVHLNSALKYLQTKLSSVPSSLSLSHPGGAPVLHVTSPLSLATQRIFSSLFSELSSLQSCDESERPSQSLNCIAEILCSLPTNQHSTEDLSPSQSLCNEIETLSGRWTLLKEQHQQHKRGKFHESYELNQLRCALVLILTEQQIRLAVLSFLRVFNQDKDHGNLCLTQFEVRTGELIRRISEDLLAVHDKHSCPWSSWTRECCCWCGKTSEEEQEIKLFQCSRCKLVMYCR
jgi:hypothetical protein